MAHLSEYSRDNDYTQDIQTETPVNNPDRADIEDAIVFSGLELPDVNMKYLLSTKNGKFLHIFYRKTEDIYIEFSGTELS